MCFSTTYRITPENTKPRKTNSKLIKLCAIDRKKCRKECLTPNRTCPFIKRVLKC